MGQDPYQALMPDITPRPQRGRITGFLMFMGLVDQASLVFLPFPPETKFAIVAGVMRVTTLLTCALVRETAHPPETGEALAHHRRIGEALRGLGTLRQARKALLALFFFGFGVGAVLPSLTRFVKAITHCTDHQAEQMFLVLMISAALVVLPFGWLTDKIGPKRVLFLGISLIALAALDDLLVTTLPQVAVVLALAGLGNAAQSASAYPLLTSTVPSEEVGFYTGLQTTALSLAAPLTSIVTGLLVQRGGYRFIFVVCAASIACALMVLSQLKQAAATAEIQIRDREQGRVS